MTGETLVEMPQILYRVKIHQKAYFKVSKKKRNFGTSMGELWICQNFKKKYWNFKVRFWMNVRCYCSTGETIWNYMGNHLTPELKPHCGTKAVVLSGRLPFLICIYP